MWVHAIQDKLRQQGPYVRTYAPRYVNSSQATTPITEAHTPIPLSAYASCHLPHQAWASFGQLAVVLRACIASMAVTPTVMSFLHRRTADEAPKGDIMIGYSLSKTKIGPSFSWILRSHLMTDCSFKRNGSKTVFSWTGVEYF